MKKIQNQKGFTVAELLVAMAIFAVVISIASTIFIRSLRAQRAVVKLIEVNENTSITLERLAREIRTGTDFPSSGTYQDLTFTNARGEDVRYFLSENRIQETIYGQTLPLTAEGVYVDNLEFVIGATNQVPRVTILLQVGLPENTQDISEVKSQIQTTVSVRPLNN
ncbi:MAG: type II secretion system protein [Candidatus Paceibacterota bacterium]